MSAYAIDAENPRYTLNHDQVATLRDIFAEALDRRREVDAEERRREANFALRLATKGSLELSHRQLYLLCSMVVTRNPRVEIPEFCYDLFRKTSAGRLKAAQEAILEKETA